jgi:hypothetical protein
MHRHLTVEGNFGDVVAPAEASNQRKVLKEVVRKQ